MKAYGFAEKAARLLARKRWVSAKKHLNLALHLAPDCIAAHISTGRLELMLKRMKQAKDHFNTALRLNPRVALQKELGWLALEDGNFSLAISMLTDHLQRNAVDFEACNLLIQCFFETGRYELGSLLAKTVITQKPGNDCFENNHFLCELMANEASHSFLDDIDRSAFVSPFTRMNFDIATEADASWSRENGPPLKSKLLFQAFRFGKIARDYKEQTTETTGSSHSRSIGIDLGDGYRYSFSTPLITLGRNPSNNVPLAKNGISRRHAVIVNYPGDVWIYDLGSLSGIRIDDLAVEGKAYLDGVRTLKIGPTSISLKTNEELLI